MAASIHAKDGDLEVGSPKPLFEVSLGRPGVPYDVAPDGRRFLVNKPSRPADLSPLTLLVNWTASLPSASNR